MTCDPQLFELLGIQQGVLYLRPLLREGIYGHISLGRLTKFRAKTCSEHFPHPPRKKSLGAAPRRSARGLFKEIDNIAPELHIVKVTVD